MASITLTLPEALKRAIAAYNDGKFSGAERLCRGIIAAKPDFFDALHLLAVIERRLGRLKDALTNYDRALAVRPNHSEALHSRGLTLYELKRFDEALTSFEQAQAVRPDYADALHNRSATLHVLKRFDEALASFEQALAVRPDFGETHFNEAICRLLIGDFDRGWEKFEWRQHKSKRNFRQPIWLGSNELTGKVVLLHGERLLGFGDMIQFCRYVPLVAERAARVILEAQPLLRELMNTLPGGAQVVSEGEPLPDFDMHCPVYSLPLAFKTRLETIPSATPYLCASSQAVMNWNARLDRKGRPRIGLCWSSNERTRHLSSCVPYDLALG
jgi:tetratricopeptide (TPR) repeat protein